MTAMFVKGLIVGWILGYAYARLRRWIDEPIQHGPNHHRWN